MPLTPDPRLAPGPEPDPRRPPAPSPDRTPYPGHKPDQPPEIDPDRSPVELPRSRLHSRTPTIRPAREQGAAAPGQEPGSGPVGPINYFVV